MPEAPTRTIKAPSAVTAASNAFVAARLAEATALGDTLASLAPDPNALFAAINQGFRSLGDEANAAGARSIAPGLGANLGVRLPLMEAAHKAFKRGTRRVPPLALIDIVDRLVSEEPAEVRWFGMWNLARLLPSEPERTWTILRRAAHEAGEWITIDTLAHPYGEGILRDPRRWEELDRLTTSTSRWERRLVGSTLATMPHVKVPGAQGRRVEPHGMTLLEQLIGDSEPDVQKALSWALRTYAQLDPALVAAFARAEAQTARRTNDGNRAWVIRDCLSKLPGEAAAKLRADLDGIRRNANATSTSSAATAAAVQFAAAGTAPGPGRASGRNSAP